MNGAGNLLPQAVMRPEVAEQLLGDDADVTPEWLRRHGYHRPMLPASDCIYASPGCERPGRDVFQKHTTGYVICHITIEFPAVRKPGVLPIWAVTIMGYRRIELNAPPTRRWIREIHEALKLPWEDDEQATSTENV
jgi:hypothetical protein